eukprot:1172227-Rhodomonas_salina.1
MLCRGYALDPIRLELHNSILTDHRSELSSQCLVLTAKRGLLTDHCSRHEPSRSRSPQHGPPPNHYSQIITTHYLLITIHYPLFTIHYSPLTFSLWKPAVLIISPNRHHAPASSGLIITPYLPPTLRVSADREQRMDGRRLRWRRK